MGCFGGCSDVGFGDDKVDGESDHGRIDHHRIPLPVTCLVLQNWIWPFAIHVGAETGPRRVEDGKEDIVADILNAVDAKSL